MVISRSPLISLTDPFIHLEVLTPQIQLCSEKFLINHQGRNLMIDSKGNHIKKIHPIQSQNLSLLLVNQGKGLKLKIRRESRRKDQVQGFPKIMM